MAGWFVLGNFIFHVFFKAPAVSQGCQSGVWRMAVLCKDREPNSWRKDTVGVADGFDVPRFGGCYDTSTLWPYRITFLFFAILHRLRWFLVHVHPPGISDGRELSQYQSSKPSQSLNPVIDPNIADSELLDMVGYARFGIERILKQPTGHNHSNRDRDQNHIKQLYIQVRNGSEIELMFHCLHT